MFYSPDFLARRKFQWCVVSGVTRVLSAIVAGFGCAGCVEGAGVPGSGLSCGSGIPRKQWLQGAAERFHSSVAVSIPVMLISLVILVAVIATRRRYSWAQLDGRRPFSTRHAVLLLWLPVITFAASLFFILESISTVSAVDTWLMLGIFEKNRTLPHILSPILWIPTAFCITTPLIGTNFGEDDAQVWVWCCLGGAAAILSLLFGNLVHPFLSAIALSFCFGCFTIGGRVRAIRSVSIEHERLAVTSEYWKSKDIFWWILCAIFGSVIWFICFAFGELIWIT